jgi:hypothetical protein
MPPYDPCPVVVQEDVIFSLLEGQLSVISVGILPETMMYIAVSAESSIRTVTVYCFGIVVQLII